MKDQFSSNCDDPILANERLKNKLDFLERQSVKRENYVKQIQRNLKLSKQTIKSLTQKNPAQHEILSQFQEQNRLLLQKLKHEHSSICKLNALYLMECQLRVEQLKNYNQRIVQFQENMAELRRYLHDKEESFSFVAQKLKKFEELIPNQQLGMYEKLINYSGAVHQQFQWKDIIHDLVQDRNAWKKLAQQAKQKAQKLQIILHGIKNFQKLQIFDAYVSSMSSEKINKLSGSLNSNTGGSLLSINNEGKNQTNLSTNLTYSQQSKSSIQPNIQLIRLMKKQKFNNKILQAALTQGIQKNLQLIEYNKMLILSNQNFKAQVNMMIADTVILCNVLSKYEQNYKTKLRILIHQSKCDLQMPSYRQIIDRYKKNDLYEANQILFTKMRNDVEEMSEYIALCPLKKTNNLKSYECPISSHSPQLDMQISLNQQQLDVSQI